MPICAVSQAAYCFAFAELSLIVVRLPLCAVSQGSSLCLSARYRRLHMLPVCQTIFTHGSPPALCSIAGFKLMPTCAVSQAAYALCCRITMDLCPTPATHGIAGRIHIWWILCTVPIAGCICVLCRQHNLSININQLLFCAIWDRLPSLAYICEPA